MRRTVVGTYFVKATIPAETKQEAKKQYTGA